MSPERFRRIEELHHAAREQTPGDRAVLLAQTDPELRRDIELLLAQPEGGEFLDPPAFQNAPALAEDSVEVAAGACLGPYRIESKLGEGGMGQVFRAVDTRLGRAVDIKITHERFSVRFERESRAIASLNHPDVPERRVRGGGASYCAGYFADGDGGSELSLVQASSPVAVTFRSRARRVIPTDGCSGQFI